MIVIRDPETFCFTFNWMQYVDENLKHEIELIIKSDESLAENKIINKIVCRTTHECRKQRKK